MSSIPVVVTFGEDANCGTAAIISDSGAAGKHQAGRFRWCQFASHSAEGDEAKTCLPR
jgi:hypothetical protein